MFRVVRPIRNGKNDENKPEEPKSRRYSLQLHSEYSDPEMSDDDFVIPGCFSDRDTASPTKQELCRECNSQFSVGWGTPMDPVTS